VQGVGVSGSNAEKPAQARVLPGLRSAADERQGGGSSPALSPRSARKITDGQCAVDFVVRVAVDTGQGVRFGCVGDSGTGKTELLKRVIEAYVRGTGGAVVVVDDGAQAGYVGEERVNRADARMRPIRGTRLVLVGDVFSGIAASPEEGATIAWALARRRKKVVCVTDELNDAARNRCWLKGVVMLPAAYTKGRKHGLSGFWTTQRVQDCLGEVFDQSDYIAVFRLVGLGLDRLEERGYLRGIDRSVIERLPGFDAPEELRGQFVLLRRGLPWDGRIYRLRLAAG
jgi:hypothetical protein